VRFRTQLLRIVACAPGATTVACVNTTSANSEWFKDAKKQTKRAEAKTSARTSILHPVGRAVQAAVCRTAEAGAIPARDSISPGIGVERHTPVFQTGVKGALPSCPSISRAAKSRCWSELHRSGRRGSTLPSCRAWVANFDSEVPALNRREHGANPWQPTNSNAECGARNAESRLAGGGNLLVFIPHSAFRIPHLTRHPW
jgi:hypothetical protein